MVIFANCLTLKNRCANIPFESAYSAVGFIALLRGQFYKCLRINWRLLEVGL